jgi:MinD superfamily P-loop ATPase
MIVTVGGIKGGSGKTTVATNLAILCGGSFWNLAYFL